MSRFSIIIPSRNAANLVACIRAIREAGETARIIVVDDGAWVYACEDYGFLVDKSIFGERGVKPFVFARNINIGIRIAGDDDVILLNDDALLKEPDSQDPNDFKMGFSKLADCAARNLDYGLISSSCSNVGNASQRHRGGVARYTHMFPPGGLRDEPRMVCFVCVYIPRSTINAVGLLDERFIGYGLDDDDYCLRVRSAGLKIGVFDGCYVDHASLKSSFRGEAGAGGDFSGNMRLFIEKWGVDNHGNDQQHSRFARLFPERHHSDLDPFMTDVKLT